MTAAQRERARWLAEEAHKLLATLAAPLPPGPPCPDSCRGYEHSWQLGAEISQLRSQRSDARWLLTQLTGLLEEQAKEAL